MGAADPGRFQQLFLFFLVVRFLLVSLPVSAGLVRVSAPDGREAAFFAQS